MATQFLSRGLFVPRKKKPRVPPESGVEPKPGQPGYEIPNSLAVEDNGGPEELKVKKQARMAEERRKAIEAAGPLPPLPERTPSFSEDMRRAWLVGEHPLDGPGVVKLRKIVKDDFASFMAMYRAEEKRDAALSAVRAENAALKAEVESLRASVPAAGGVDEGEERVRELIERLLEEVEGKPWEK